MNALDFAGLTKLPRGQHAARGLQVESPVLHIREHHVHLSRKQNWWTTDTIGRFRYSFLMIYTDRSCADIISRCAVLLPTSCYLSFLICMLRVEASLHVQCKMYRFLIFRSFYTVWVKTCRETEIAHSECTYTSFCFGCMTEPFYYGKP